MFFIDVFFGEKFKFIKIIEIFKFDLWCLCALLLYPTKKSDITQNDLHNLTSCIRLPAIKCSCEIGLGDKFEFSH